MSQAERFKSRIIDVEWTPVPPQLRSPQPQSVSEAITTYAWSSRVTNVVEEVQLNGTLDPRLVVLKDPGSAPARSYRLLQHRLFAKGDPRVVVVTSAEAGEGKTTCAANLALGKTTCAANLALVLSEETLARVLLLEANLPRPALADVFGFEPADSFMIRLLEGEDAVAPYPVASVNGMGLQLAALKPEPVRDRRLERALLSTAIRDLRNVYDYIVIDAAAVLENADANSVSQCADGVVVTARAGRSRKSSLRRALEQLAPAEVLGTVLIDT
jgi:Mrp family chromosome partitioning ATPase